MGTCRPVTLATLKWSMEARLYAIANILLLGFLKKHPVLPCRGKFLPKTPQLDSDRMHIETLLNRIEKQPGFIYDTCRWRDSGPPALVVTLRPKAGSKPICSKCGERRMVKAKEAPSPPRKAIHSGPHPSVQHWASNYGTFDDQGEDFLIQALRYEPMILISYQQLPLIAKGPGDIRHWYSHPPKKRLTQLAVAEAQSGRARAGQRTRHGWPIRFARIYD